VPRPERPSLLPDLVLVVAVLVVYLPALGAGFIWDDDHYVTANASLRSLDGLRRIWFEPGTTPQYYPVTFTSLWLDFQLWATSPLGYHLENVLWHAAATVMLWRVLRRLEVPGAWVAAALFGLHPIAVESVAWVTERKNVLSTTCYLAAALVYLRVAGVPAADRWRGSRVAYGLVVLLFVAALLSKSVTASLPAALALALWWYRGRLDRADVVRLLPLLMLGAAAGLGTAWVERHYVGARGADWSLTVADRVLVAGRAVWFYLSTLAWPVDLTFIYPRWTVDVGDPRQWAFPIAAVALLVVAWMLRSRVGRGPLVALLLFGGTLVPALGFIDVYPMRYSFVADHFAYLATIGPFALVAAVTDRLARQAPRAVTAITALLLAVLGAATWMRIGAYHDAETLWRDTVSRNPGAWMAHNNLGVLLYERGEVTAALERYRTAETLAPQAAEIQINLGNALTALGHTDEGLAAYRAAIARKPTSAGAYNALGASLYEIGRHAEAIDAYRAAIALRPGWAEPYNNLGSALMMQHDVPAAIAAYGEALALRPDHPETLNNLGVALLHDGQAEASRARLEEALARRPDYPEAESNLGNALLRLDRPEEALAAYRRAIALKPGYVEAQFNLGHLLALQGQTAEARAHLEEALRLDPGLEVARHRLDEIAAAPASPQRPVN
jgi:tetratricopeptide (TPR) repeat protein